MMRKVVAGVALAFVLVAARLGAESALDFTLVNKTGYGISKLYVSPSASDDWEDNMLKNVLEHNESIEIQFHRKAENVQKWDLMIVFVDDDEEVYWRGYKLAEVSKITLKYDRKTGETTAITE
jgi:hypothetical protein